MAAEADTPTAHPLFQAAKLSLASTDPNRHENAIRLFGELLAHCEGRVDPESLAIAPVYFEYGSALLVTAEQAKAGHVDGVAASGAVDEEDGDDADEEDEEDEEDDDDDDDDGAEAEGAEDVDDLGLAVDYLEKARDIYQAALDSEEAAPASLRAEAARSHSRLGDANLAASHPADAIAMYLLATTLWDSAGESSVRDARRRADSHASVATAILTHIESVAGDVAVDLGDGEVVLARADERLDRANEHYGEATKILSSTLLRAKSEGGQLTREEAEDLAFLNTILLDIGQRIDAMTRASSGAGPVAAGGASSDAAAAAEPEGAPAAKKARHGP